MLIGRINREQPDVTRITVDFTPWLDPLEQIAAISSIETNVDLSGWARGPYPPQPPADPTPLEIQSWSILSGLLLVEMFIVSGTPGNAYTIQLNAVGVSGRRITLEIGVQVTGTPPAYTGAPPTTAQEAAAAAQAAAPQVLAQGAMPLAGGSFLGPAYVAADPTAPLQIADKQYVDNLFAGEVTLVGQETTRAEAAEAALGTSITAETTRAEAAEAALGTSIAAETTRAEAAEATLTAAVATAETNITAETTRAEAAEATLTAAVSTAETNITAVNASASASIVAETTRAEAAEATLNTAISSEATTRAAAVSAETSRAETAEAAISNSIAPTVAVETSRAEAAEAAISATLGAFSRVIGVTAGTTLTTGQVNALIVCGGSDTFSVGLPDASSCPVGCTLTFICASGATVTVTSGATQIFIINGGAVASFTLTTGLQGAMQLINITSLWVVTYLTIGLSDGGNSGGGNSGGECFVAGQPVTMADGSQVAIENVQPGDLVKGAAGEANKVIAVAYSTVRKRVMWNINEHHLTTADHPHVSADRKAMHSIDPTSVEAYWGHAENVVQENGVIASMTNAGLKKGRVQPLTTGLSLLGVDGSRAVSSIKPVAYHPNTTLYNLVVGGSHTFFVDGYAVTGWPREDDYDYDTWQPRSTLPAASANTTVVKGTSNGKSTR